MKELQIKPDSAPGLKESRRDEIERMRREEIAKNKFVIDAIEGNTANAEDWTKYGLKSNQKNLALLERDPVQYFQEVIKSQDLLQAEGWNSPEQISVTEKIKGSATQAIRELKEIQVKY